MVFIFYRYHMCMCVYGYVWVYMCVCKYIYIYIYMCVESACVLDKGIPN